MEGNKYTIRSTVPDQELGGVEVTPVEVAELANSIDRMLSAVPIDIDGVLVGDIADMLLSMLSGKSTGENITH
ncbi:hypothetical protein JW796_03870 [Candidatus Dojkabacteria bacterium]|nr:hypothetical protein [Candidatus Dojkabacteria bacterium]